MSDAAEPFQREAAPVVPFELHALSLAVRYQAWVHQAVSSSLVRRLHSQNAARAARAVADLRGRVRMMCARMPRRPQRRFWRTLAGVWVLLAGLGFGTAGLAAGPACTAAEPGAITCVHSIHAAAGEGETTVSSTVMDGRLVLDVHSPTGIGHASVRRLVSRWPSEVVLRLHVGGLERLHVKTAKAMFELSVHARRTGKALVRLSNEAGRQRLDPALADPPYVTWRVETAADGSRAGYFEVPVHGRLLEDNPVELRLHWVDFFRV